MKISALALEPLLAKMSAGFQTNLNAVALSTYGVKPFTIAFPATIYSPNTPTFILGKVLPDTIDKYGVVGATKVTMFVDQSENMNYEKPNDFSGMIVVGMDFHLAWQSSDMKQNFEALTLAVEDAVAETLQLYLIQNWGSVVYNGAFKAIRGMLEIPDQGQGSLRQLLAFRFVFQLDI